MTNTRKKRIRELAEKLDVSRRSAANLVDAGRPREVREDTSDSEPLTLAAPPPWAGPDGEWLRHASWEPILAELWDRQAGRVALERLREEFPPPWSIVATTHPVLLDCAFRLNRIALLEIGHVLATVRCGRVRHRLRDPLGYAGVRAELRAGALLSGAGAEMTHEPLPPCVAIRKSQRPSGPDWHADWHNGSIYVEVKLSRTSMRAHRREGWASLYMSEFQAALSDDVLHGDGRYATLCMSDASLDCMGDDLNDTTLVRARGRSAAAAFVSLVRLHRGLKTLTGRFTLADECEVVVRSRVDGRQGLALDGAFAASDDHRVTLRLRTHLSEAAQQLERMPGQRVILLDTSNDSALRAPAETIRALLGEPWAERLAAVMIVYRHWPHTTVDIVPGPATDSSDACRLIASKLRTCERGHLHADSPLIAPPTSSCTFQG